MRTNDLWLLTVSLWLGPSWLTAYLASGITSVTRLVTAKKQIPKPLTPRAEDDCPACQADHLPAVVPQRLTEPPPPPWAALKSRRGRPKSFETEGYACLNLDCPYYRMTNSRVHALVANGTHGHDRIQDLVCQACGHKFSVRRDTALYRLRTLARIVGTVLALLAEGFDPNAVQRIFGLQESTVRLWLTRAGLHAQSLHDHLSHDLKLAHVQLDELFTTARQADHNLWLWVALDATTKFIPALILGPRTQDMAHQLIHQLRQTLATSHLPVFSSDGLKLYFYALTAHFGQWL